jgi:LAO/AO transport system kinase
MSHPDKHRPEWTPENAGPEFASHVMPGVKGGGNSSSQNAPRRQALTIDEYARGVLDGNRSILARAITLIESDSPKHHEQARQVLNRIITRSGNSIRIGITGIPGAGKSTFIESFGLQLVEKGHKVAVLAVDPSSTLTRGSVLGDKTRMEQLARHPSCFIRPSPSGGALGGVARKSRETMIACEAAGFDVIIVETVGVGQSETTVRSMVDFFLLLAITGAGDELQGIKRGITELADAIIINKADGDNKQRALATRSQYEMALHYLQPATDGWRTTARTCSALTGEGVAEVWEMIERFRKATTESGVLELRRRRQTLEWMNAMIEEGLRSRFLGDEKVAQKRKQLQAEVLAGNLSAAAAVEALLDSQVEN